MNQGAVNSYYFFYFFSLNPTPGRVTDAVGTKSRQFKPRQKRGFFFAKKETKLTITNRNYMLPLNTNSGKIDYRRTVCPRIARAD